ncbi:DUF1016 N-terminal domain-containing protein [Sphingobacterium multivorum]|uniref:DUF1016 N-terminal domain-containing protein n=1 Tax=Sphingobacterium multivorum TaxID=28454 RepID=UPI0028AF0BD1|nr:DUF1016 N-terminal domain-containing protein [Sphingobacterium multivorum]
MFFSRPYYTFTIVSTQWTQLSWSQYKLLLSLNSEEQREFYIAETIKNNWTSRQLECQVFSNLLILFDNLLWKQIEFNKFAPYVSFKV